MAVSGDITTEASFAKRGEYDESIAYFDKALAVDPNDAYPLNNKKSTLEEIKQLFLLYCNLAFAPEAKEQQQTANNIPQNYPI